MLKNAQLLEKLGLIQTRTGLFSVKFSEIQYAILKIQSPPHSEAAVWDEVVVTPEAFDAGAEVVLHLHNHGANSWNVNRLRTVE